MSPHRWCGLRPERALSGVTCVPSLGVMPHEEAVALADGPSLVPGAQNVREGVVVRPLVYRTHAEIGRVILKIVSGEYLARKGR